MLKPVVTVPVFAVHGLLDGARSKGLATESWLDGVLAQARIAESLLHLEQSRVTIEQYIALFSAVKNRSEEHTSELQSQSNLVCRLLLEKKKKQTHILHT